MSNGIGSEGAHTLTSSRAIRLAGSRCKICSSNSKMMGPSDASPLAFCLPSLFDNLMAASLSMTRLSPVGTRSAPRVAGRRMLWLAILLYKAHSFPASWGVCPVRRQKKVIPRAQMSKAFVIWGRRKPVGDLAGVEIRSAVVDTGAAA